ncbi:relaxin-3 precursor, partial [Daubentonia madagascariensis]
VMPSRMQAP